MLTKICVNTLISAPNKDLHPSHETIYETLQRVNLLNWQVAFQIHDERHPLIEFGVTDKIISVFCDEIS
jgi:hypothetical protein